MSKNLEVKILRTKDFGRNELACAVTASTMIAHVMGCAQGQMSQSGCGNSWGDVVPRPVTSGGSWKELGTRKGDGPAGFL